MAVVGSLTTIVDANISKFKKGMKKASLSLNKFKKGIIKSRHAIAGFSAAMTAIAATSIKSASDFQEAQNKFSVVFSSISKDAVKMRNELNKAFGLSKLEATELLAATGDLLTGLGFTEEAALGLSGQVNKLAVDMASFGNIEGGSARVAKILNKALVGQRGSLDELGIAIGEADVKQRLMAKGQQDLTGLALRQAKAQASLELIYEQTGKAQGDYARSAGSLAHTFKELRKNVNDLSVSLGEKLVPSLNTAISKINDFVDEGGIEVWKASSLTAVEKVNSAFQGMASGLGISPLASYFQENSKVLKANIDELMEQSNRINDESIKAAANARKKLDMSDVASQNKNKMLSGLEEFRRKIESFSFQGMTENLKSNLGGAFSSIGNNLKESFDEAMLKIKQGLEEQKRIMTEQARSVFDQTRSPYQRFEIEMEKLQKLFDSGALDPFGGKETFDKRARQLKKEMEEAQRSIFESETVEAKHRAKRKKEKDKGPERQTLARAMDIRNIGFMGAGKKGTEREMLSENKKQNEFLKQIARNTRANKDGTIAVAG